MFGACPPSRPRALLSRGLLLVACLVAGPASGLSEDRRFSDYAIDNWTVADGLPQVAVQTLEQDGDGYLWVGTQSAIARFDGVRFEVFDRPRTGGIDTSMSESSYRARDGHVWFATRDGALRLRRDRVEHFAAAGIPLPVQAVAEWPAGSMVFGTARGLYALEAGALVPSGLEGMDIGALLDVGPALWVGARGRLLRREGGQTRSLPLPGGEDLRITQLLKQGDRLWIATSRGLWVLDGEGEPRPYTAEPGLATLPIESLCADSGGSVWIGTAPRLFRLRSDGGLVAVSDGQFVRNPWVNACMEDREGNLWLGSQTESLFRVWDGLVARLTEEDGLRDPFVWSLEGDGEGGVFLGSNSGLYRWTRQGIQPLARGGDLPDAAVYELARLEDGRLWVGTRGGLREWSEGRLGLPRNAERLEGLQVNAIVPAADSVWVGTSGGLFRSTPDRGLQAVGDGAFEGAALRVRALLPDGADRVIVGTEDGLRLVDGAEVSVPDWAQFLRGRMITALARLGNGAMLVGTLDSGITVVAGERAIRLDSASLLPSLNAWTFRVHDGWLYVSSIEGLYRVPLERLPDPARPGTEAPASLDARWVISMAGRDQSGQRARCCNGGARARALLVDEQLWLPSISGVLRVNLAAIGSGNVEPLVHVEGAMVDEVRHDATAGPLVLDGDRRDLRIDFTALHFRSPRSMRFDYRLEGYDTKWVDAGDRRSAFYTNLPPGEFQFRVRARDDFGASIQAGNSLEVSVVPHWHERLVVRAAIGLALVALAGLGVLAALRRQRWRTAQLEALVDERTHQLQRANERLEQANAALAVESQTDTLTGLPNRRAVFQEMPAMLAHHPEGVVLALVDIDHFKRVNDDYGHAAGDVVLRDFAAFLRRATREGDLLARWGGEEFLIVFGGLPDEAIPARMQRLLADGRSLHFDLGADRPLHIAFSVGWTRHPLPDVPAADWERGLALADTALYRAKAGGRDTWFGLVAGDASPAGDATPRTDASVDELVAQGRLRWITPSSRAPAW